MKIAARIKRIFQWTGVFLLCVIVLLVGMPLWFPWVLRPVGKHFGLRYSRYEREGYSRFALESVVYTNRGVRVEAGRVEGFVPTVWAWKHFANDTNSVYVSVADWQLTVSSSTNRPSKRPASVYRTAGQIGTLLTQIDRWIPVVVLTNGSVHSKKQVVHLNELHWRHGNFRSQVQPPLAVAPVTVVGSVVEQPWVFRIGYPALEVRADLQALESPSNLVVSGMVFVQTNRVSVTAEFGREAALPKQAILECSAFSLPARLLRLDGYNDLAGAFSLMWTGTNFTTEAHANTTPGRDSKLGPVNVALKAQGDLHRADIQRLKILLPGFAAELSTNVAIPFAPGARPAVLKISGDLRQQPWLGLEGVLQGQAVLTPGTNVFPDVDFSLTATNFGTKRLQASALAISAELLWPTLTVREAQAAIGPNGIVQLSTIIDWTSKEVCSGRFQYEGQLPDGVLLPRYSAEAVSLAADFAGPIKNLRHHTEAQISGLKSAQLQPMSAQITADGEGQSIKASASLRAAESVLECVLSTKASVGTNEIHLDKLTLSSRGQSLLGLVEPVSIRLASQPSVHASRITHHEFNFSPVHLRGGDRKIDLDVSIQWPQQGYCRAEVHSILLDDFRDFVGPRFNGIRVQDLQFATEWRDGPASLLLIGHASFAQGPGFAARGEIRGNGSGILLSNISVSSQSAPVITARGFLPISIRPGATNFVEWRQDKALDLRANMQPDPEFWERVRSATGIRLVRPEINVNVSGSWNAPTGWVHAAVAQASLTQTNRLLPAVANVRMTAELNTQKLRLDEFRFVVDNQPVEISAELPLDAQFYRAIGQRKLPDLSRGSARLRIAQARLGTFAWYLPNVLTPLGVLDVDVALQPGNKLDGHVSVSKATTQPLGPFGAVRDIDTNLRLKGQAVTLEHFSATIGGESIEATGTLDSSGTKWLRGDVPPFRLRVKGHNIPLVREPEAIVRADLDLNLSHGSNASPLISGTINLRDSFYTSDLESLFPGKVLKPDRRPPYFSVTAPTVADWKLDCRVKGQRFLKLRTPFFKGTASTDFKLEGTLREPFASGEATLNEGQVNFPFGTLEMKQGILSVTAADPYRPTLYATARARRFGYDITMEITGSGDKPIIQFSSVPSLPSEQILLLLSAGELPRDELTFSPQQKAQRFAVFLGQRLLSKLGIGGDEERLSVRSGEEISESGRQTYDVEYKLDRNWSLVGQYDRFNAFNLSLKRRIFSR